MAGKDGEGMSGGEGKETVIIFMSLPRFPPSPSPPLTQVGGIEETGVGEKEGQNSRKGRAACVGQTVAPQRPGLPLNYRHHSSP